MAALPAARARCAFAAGVAAGPLVAFDEAGVCRRRAARRGAPPRMQDPEARCGTRLPALAGPPPEHAARVALHRRQRYEPCTWAAGENRGRRARRGAQPEPAQAARIAAGQSIVAPMWAVSNEC